MTTSTIALIGNPNCGKTTLFNLLTGHRQKVGNWPGVTVERKEGILRVGDTQVRVMDLPGIYSLTPHTDFFSLDERIAVDFLMEQQVNTVINVVDITNLERSFYLTLQLLEMGLDVIIVLNRMDLLLSAADKNHIQTLQQVFQCPVVAISALYETGIAELKKSILRHQRMPTLNVQYQEPIENALTTLQLSLTTNAEYWLLSPRWFCLRLLEGDTALFNSLDAEAQTLVTREQDRIYTECHDAADILVASRRYEFIQPLMEPIQHLTDHKKNRFTRAFDRIVLHRVLGLPCFFAMMYLVFFFAMNIGGALQDFFDLASAALFINAPAALLTQWHLPDWLIVVIANGIGTGLNTIVTFIPVLSFLFFGLALLEASGYMARAAFVMDRVMRMLGLPGQSFVPLIIGFGCNVPAVMAARTLGHPKDRILTILMTPFMSCSARLAIYAVFAAAFFKSGAQNIIFLLYLIGVFAAVLSGFVLRKTWLQGESSPLLMELPIYQRPAISNLLLQTWQRLRSFLVRATKVIIPLCVILGILNSWQMDGHFSVVPTQAESLLAQVGQLITPIFAPMGITANNWPATVGLLTGTLAKEVVIATLNTLYTQSDAAIALLNFNLAAELRAAVQTIPANFSELAYTFLHPLSHAVTPDPVSSRFHFELAAHFAGPIGAFAYLLFIVLYYPCLSTVMVIARELNRVWAFFAMIWSTLLAYCVSVIFYQATCLFLHPWSAVGWILLCLGILSTFIAMMVMHFPTSLNVATRLSLHAGGCQGCQGCPQKPKMSQSTL